MNRRKLNINFMGERLKVDKMLKLMERYGILKVRHHIPLIKNLERLEDLMKLSRDDSFGYASQGFLYGESQKKDFGGWIAINKSTGEWTVCETPPAVDEHKKKALKSAKIILKH